MKKEPLGRRIRGGIRVFLMVEVLVQKNNNGMGNKILKYVELENIVNVGYN